MSKTNIVLLIMLTLLMISSPVIAQKDCAIEATDCTYEAMNVGSYTPTIDGDLSDWELAKGVFIGKDCWEDYKEAYSGNKDLSATWWILWDEDNLYIALKVVDDKHQNSKSGASIWDGDGIQFAIDPTAEKVVYGGNSYEYGYALSGGDALVWRWSTNPKSEGENSEYVIVRDDATDTTIYEIRIPEGDIAPADISGNNKIGWAIIVNESDELDTQGGWVGWGAHAIVFGKEAPPMGDVVFSPETLSVSPAGKLSALWGRIKTKK